MRKSLRAHMQKKHRNFPNSTKPGGYPTGLADANLFWIHLKEHKYNQTEFIFIPHEHGWIDAKKPV